MPLLEIADLSVTFATARGPFRAVASVDLAAEAGEVLGVVGETGSGKSVTMLAAMGLIDAPGHVAADALRFDGRDLLGISPRGRRRLVGRDMAMVFQEPMSSLNPCYPVGWQIGESLRAHHAVPRAQTRARTVELLDQVGIPAPETRLGSFPHQLSGGMNQRVMIAMAIACNPRLLIADEPTTALDVTIQKQILDLLVELQRQRGMALVLITHDMGVVAETAQRVQVMYAGEVVEEAPTAALFAHPRHPYTAALLDALPERAVGAARLPTIPGMVPGIADRPSGCLFNPRCALRHRPLRGRTPGADRRAGPPRALPLSAGRAGRPTGDHPAGGARVTPAIQGGDAGARPAAALPHRRRHVRRKPAWCARSTAWRSSLHAGQTLAVVGETGCGKSTLARMAALMERPTRGDVAIDGKPTADITPAERRRLRLGVQMVFQNPYGSLNPRKTVGAILTEPLAINHRGDARARADAARAMMARVGLREDQFGRYPHMFSGGQRQRIAIARALMLNPRVVVADEPVSALDVSIQAQVLNLMMDLQDEFSLAYLFISHDLSVVRHIAREVLVLYLGRPAEFATKAALFAHPRHPYTRMLLAATPSVEPGARQAREPVRGELPSPLDPPAGCAFASRCPHATDRCRAERPEFRAVGESVVACHYAEAIG